MSERRVPRGAGALFAVTVLLSAVLLFLVQPMVARMLLPRLGGSPSTWTTCMLFFQLTLLAGYLYAHVLASRLTTTVQVVVHLAVLAAAAATLPMRLPEGGPAGDASPVPWLLAAVAAGAGAPFFALSASAPLAQRWFARASGRDPYRLYAASNAGSLVGLLAYPLLLERWLPLASQRTLWAVGFAVLVVLMAACGLAASRAPADAVPHADGVEDDGAPVQRRAWLHWIALAAVPSSLLLGVTTHLSTDIAAVPLLWVVPLAIYLLTFVAAFAAPPPIRRAWPIRLAPFLVVAALAAMVLRQRSWWAFALHLLAFACVALVCHRELADRRPPARRLTFFFLCLSLGGALGGVFNALVAPRLFTDVTEYPLALALALWLRPRVDPGARPEPWPALVAMPLVVAIIVGAAWRLGGLGDLPAPAVVVTTALIAAAALAFAVRSEPAAAAALLAVAANAVTPASEDGRILFSARSFFGVHRVALDGARTRHVLSHGTTLHGWQAVADRERCAATSYYHATGPIGQLLAERGARARRVAAIGLGAGSVSCHGRPGARWTFFEIDRVVERIARDPALFTFLARSPAHVDVAIGDGRLLLAREPAGSLDVIVVDAFSSDAVPVHLLTEEFLSMALDRLAADGVLALHISNRFLDLEPIVGAAAARLGARALHQLHRPDALEAVTSRWIVMARDARTLAALAADPRWRPAVIGPRAWTDDHANLLDAVMWRRGSEPSADGPR